MKKVLLVDDEIVIRENIRNCVDWEGEGFQYCGDASDGELALPMIEELKPDIVITDIRMPFLDGLELCTIIRQRMPGIKIIILSGHDEFEYARAAMRLGITEYCLKPVSSAELVAILHQVSDLIDQERKEQERLQRLREHETASGRYTREKLLSDLCKGLVTTVEALQTASVLSVPLMSKYYAVITTDVRQGDDVTIPASRTVVEEAEARFREQLGILAQFLEFKDSRTERCWILKHDSREGLQEILDQVYGSLKQEVERTCGCRLLMGIGGIQDRLQHMHASYTEADEDRHWRRWSSQNLQLSRLAEGAVERPFIADRQRFIEFLKIGAPAEAAAFVAEWADALHSLDWRSDLYGFYLLNDMTIEMIQTAKTSFRHLDGLDPIFQHLQQQLAEVASWEDAVQYLSGLAELFWQWRRGATDRYAEMIRQAKAYIGRNYARDQLSLQDVADEVNVSPSHLSKVFSQETGQTFIEYLTRVRIRKAMELLQSTDDKSYAIAHQVGYQDAHYFSYLFKRMTGKTTTEFRRQGRSGITLASAEEQGGPTCESTA